MSAEGKSKQRQKQMLELEHLNSKSNKGLCPSVQNHPPRATCLGGMLVWKSAAKLSGHLSVVVIMSCSHF